MKFITYNCWPDRADFEFELDSGYTIDVSLHDNGVQTVNTNKVELDLEIINKAVLKAVKIYDAIKSSSKA